jgi:hypothetical protein
MDFDFDRPPSLLTLLIIGAGVFALLCLSCACTAPLLMFLKK